MTKRKTRKKSKSKAKKETKTKEDRMTDLQRHKRMIAQKVSEIQQRMGEERYQPVIAELTKERDHWLAVWDQLKDEEDKQLLITTKLLLDKEREKTSNLMEEAHQIEEEANYMETKKDERGIYQIKEAVYQERMNILKAELSEAKGLKEKLAINMKILGLKGRKGQKVVNNGMVILPEKIAGAMGTIGEITNDIGGQFDGMGMDEPKKKGKQSSSGGSDFENMFTPEHVFGNKKKGEKKDELDFFGGF